MKYRFYLLAILFYNLLYSQNNFEYERTWGTYFGANGGQIASVNVNKGILFDSQKNMHIRGTMWNMQNLSSTYFNQFILGGGNSYFTGNPNLFEVKISSMGIPTYYSYNNSSSSTLLEKIDHQDNKYYIIESANPSIQSTAGTYLPIDPQPSSTRKIILAKYSPTGSLLWASYLPSTSKPINIEVDEANNVYLSGNTRMAQNVATNGVFQENFDLIYNPDGSIVPNGYLLKLSPNGQRIWGSYLPCGGSYAMQYYNGAIYMITDRNTNPALNTMATPGAFQTSIAGTSLTKMNTANGTRQWGTYYGPPTSTGLAIITDLAVNETGIYITGTDYNYDGSSFFGTATSYKQFVTGGSDLFLSKFSLSGNRDWSTYFGSSAEDTNEFDQVIALDGNDVYISGTTYAAGNNIATLGSYQPTPEFNNPTSYNLYFAKFHSSGNLSWCSYYGGSSSYASILIPINIAFDNNSLFLFGSTNSNNGFSTEGAWMFTRNPSNTNDLTSFIAKFNLKDNLGVTEATIQKDFFLYDNPNNGNFTLQGSLLTKKKLSMKLYDTAGRVITTKKLNNEFKQNFDLQGSLQNGNYIIEISENNTMIKTFKMTVK